MLSVERHKTSFSVKQLLHLDSLLPAMDYLNFTVTTCNLMANFLTDREICQFNVFS